MISRADIRRMWAERVDLRDRHIGRGEQGFTLAETMLALLIVVMLTGIVATGIPVAYNTYRQVVDDSNAQLALSTTATALRDELGLAVDVKTASNGTVFYKTGEGNWATIDNGASGSAGLVKRVYAETVDGFNPNSPGTAVSTDLVPSISITGSSAGEQLRVQMVGNEGSAPFITYENNTGVFTVHGVEVLVGGVSTESIGDYKVKKIFDFAP